MTITARDDSLFADGPTGETGWTDEDLDQMLIDEERDYIERVSHGVASEARATHAMHEVELAERLDILLMFQRGVCPHCGRSLEAKDARHMPASWNPGGRELALCALCDVKLGGRRDRAMDVA